MKVICISGKAQHGKDTVAGLLDIALTEKGYTVKTIHYADLLKFICEKYFGWNGEKDDYGRSLLQRVGTDVIRNQEPDYWVDFVVTFLKLFPNEWDFVIIPDTRFPNEVFDMKDAFPDTVHLRVIRPDFDNGLSEEQKNHPSEVALDTITPDAIIYNDGNFEDLIHSIHKFLNMIGGEN